MKKIITFILFITISFGQFENVPYNENIIILIGPDNYYQSSLNEFIDFHSQYANSAGSRDHFFIITNDYNQNLYQAQVPSEKLISGTVNDIWIRDFGIQNLQGINYKFDYHPNYLDNWTANWIDNSIINWLNTYNFEFENHNLIIDGGNFQTNGNNKAVITTRIFEDNPTYSENQLRDYLNLNLGLDEIAFIPEEAGDPVGHSDGYVVWLTPTKLAVNDCDEPYRTLIYEALESSLTNVEYVVMPFSPDYGSGEDGFGSAKGIYVNSLQTTDNFYVPIFGIPEDSLALNVYEEHTNKNIIPIDATEVSNWGGSVHCLSMEILRANNNLLGDVNIDGIINVIDIIQTVNLVLNNDFQENADMNSDSIVNIIDIVQLVNIILSN